MRHHAAVLRGGQYWQRTPNWRDFAISLLVLGIVVLLGAAARQMVAPFSAGHPVPISLSPKALPFYTLRTVLRMLAALIASFLFTFSYGTLAAKSRRTEMVLIPLLDVLQSVPVLGYLSFTVLFFVSLAPGSQLGPELAAIFAIFTSQAWNMAFSFYQSLRMVPSDLDEACRALRSSAWQRFWQLEVPFAMPGLIWNTMMSMSGGWFFVVASEAIAVGDFQISLPGVGSYVARAIQQRDLGAVGCAIIAMSVAIVLYDQLLFRPVVAWADKFRFEQTAVPSAPRSWFLDWFRGSRWLKRFGDTCGAGLQRVGRLRLSVPIGLRPRALWSSSRRRLGDLLWLGLVSGAIAYIFWELGRLVHPSLRWTDLAMVARDGALTLFRVVVLIGLVSLIWVPIGVSIGLRPRLTAAVQPVAQFLAAFPVNLLFPVVVFLIVRFRLAPGFWLSPLMILGTQWYILFNVIAGVSAFPGDLREAAASFRVRSWAWWREVMLPGIFPYYVTGAITASGGAWNASIVSEWVAWGPTTLSGSGLGAYIAQMTAAGDYPRIALGIAVMSALVITMNRLLWRPLYAFAERRTRLD